jgi:LysR family transcriptional regulator, glycine cleavage system transcriptional activator
MVRSMPRRLPPLNSLRAFEAAARHLSFTKASDELCVTQGAVSRHIAGLERELGTPLFVRRHRAVELTVKGSAFFHALRDAFDRIEEASRQAQPTHARTLRIKLPPTFAIRWVVPRLARLHALDRTIDVQITTSHARVDFEREDVDVAIHSGREPPPGGVARRLFGETLFPVCSPALLAGARVLRTPADLAGHVLLCSLHRPDDWPTWIAAAGIPGVNGNNGLKFENSSLAYQAAIDNLGVVMAQKVLVADDLAAGRLVAPFGLEVVTDGAYFLSYPRRSATSDTVRLFERWICDEADRCG